MMTSLEWGTSSPRPRCSSSTTCLSILHGTPCTAASGAGRPIPTGGTTLSWSSGMTGSDSRTSTCGRSLSWSSASGLPRSLAMGHPNETHYPPAEVCNHHPMEDPYPGELLLCCEPVRRGEIYCQGCSHVVKIINTILLCRVITLGNVEPIITGFAATGFPNCGRVH